MDLIELEYTNTLNNNAKETLCFSKQLLTQKYNENSLFVSCVNGQSMQPLIWHNALVVADLSNKVLENDAIYLIIKDEQMWIKQARKNTTNDTFTFESINEEYAHLIYEQKDVHVVARVLLTFTNL